MFYGGMEKDEAVLGMCSDEINSTLAVADTKGFVSIWDIGQYLFDITDISLQVRFLISYLNCNLGNLVFLDLITLNYAIVLIICSYCLTVSSQLRSHQH